MVINDLTLIVLFFFFFQAEDGIRDYKVTGVQTCALPICSASESTGSNTWATAVGATRLEHIRCHTVHPSPRAREGAKKSNRSVIPLQWEIGRASCRERV